MQSEILELDPTELQDCLFYLYVPLTLCKRAETPRGNSLCLSLLSHATAITFTTVKINIKTASKGNVLDL